MTLPADARTVRKLVEDYYLALYRYAYRLTGSAADAEDLTQDAFCKAQMQYRQLRDPDRVKPWLFAILRNGYLRQRRDAAGVRFVPIEAAAGLRQPSDARTVDVDPDALQKALNELPEPYRTPLILFYFESFSYQEIAEQMDVPVGTVMSRLSRAKGYLRKRLLARQAGSAGAGVNA